MCRLYVHREVVYSICTSLCKILVHCQVLSYTRGEEMEAARLNLRECSLRSGPCHDEYSGSPTLSAGAVPAAPRSHGPSASRRSANCIKEYGEMFTTHIKIECNGEDPATIPTLGTARSHLQENPMSGNTLWVKEEGFEMKTEDNVHETIITEELDIGPTVLQPRIMPHSVPSSDQTGPDLRSSTSFCDDAGPPPLCTVFARPSPQTKVEDEHCESPEGPCNPTSALNVKCTEKADQRALKERAHDHSDSEHTTIDTQKEDQLGYCVEPSTECDCRTEGSKAKAGAYKGDKQYECEYWKYNTTRKSNLISHIGTHKDKESDKYEQSEDSTFGPNYFKTKISAQADQEKPYKCEVCDYSGSRVGYLQVHMRTHTGEKPFKCKHCEYSAHRMGSLQSHMRTHSGEKPYKCKQCKYSACKLGELKIHMHTHTAVKPFKCEWCEYSTRKSADLKTHLLTHTGKKPYKCELCEYSASRMGHILIHMRIHTGEKPYKCDQCDYSAYCVSHLRVHLRTHTGEKPYKCELCEYSTSYVSGLKRHMYLHMIN